VGTEPRKLPWLPALIGYGALGAPLAMLTGPVFVALPTWMVADLGVPQAAVGLALLLARIWDGACDPVAGWLSDRTQDRRIWIALGLPLTLLGAWGLFRAEPGITAVDIGLWSVVLYTGWTLMKLNHDAWGAELSPDYAERVRITTAREGAGILGGILAIMLIGYSTSGTQAPGLAWAYGSLFWLLLLTLPLGVAALLATAQPARTALAQCPGWRDTWHMLKDHASVRQLSIAYAFNNLASALPATLFILFVTHSLGRPDWQGLLILVYFVSAILGLPLWVWAGKRFGKHQAWRLSILIAALAFLPAAFFREGLEIQFAIVCVLTGVCLGGDMVLPPAIQADIADEIRLVSGKDQTAMLFALLNLITKLGYAAAVGIGFGILALVGFNQAADAQNSATAIATLAGLYAVGPAVLKILAVLSLRGFRLDAARQAAIRAQLEARA
jgi:glycoside/pentoside/hexuronide:cation symporter, GPH family